MIDNHSELELEINNLSQRCKEDTLFRLSNENKEKIQDIAKRIDNQLNSTEGKSAKAKLYLLKGKVLDLLEEYSREAEDSLSKSLKLNPVDKNTWNILGDILWKKKDYKAAKKTFEGCLENCGKSKETLRSLSMVLRCIDEEKSENVKQSVVLAKDAVALDLNDGESWYVLGNAYLTNYFVNVKQLTELQNALKAYNQAESKLTTKNPDLYFNRATVLNYLEEYEASVDNYRMSDQLDPTLNAKENIESIFERVKTVDSTIANKGKMKQKKLDMIIKNIPSVLKTQPKHLGDKKYEIKSVGDLLVGPNTQSILSCKITNVISKRGEVPAKFIFVDFKANFGCVSVYHCNDDIYEQIREQTDIYIIDPKVKEIRLTSGPESALAYKTIQVLEPDKIYIDSQKVSTIFSPSQVINKAKN